VNGSDAEQSGKLQPARWVVGYVRRVIDEDRLAAGLVLAYVATQLATIAWDLPCFYGWENDGVAPRDWFGGLAFNLMPGRAHRYPLLHYLILLVTEWPIVLVAALLAPDTSQQSIMASVLSMPALTAMALVAKCISVAMGGLGLLVLGRIARRTASSTAGRWAVLFAATNIAISYYGRSTNVDGPYMLWTVLALDRLLDVIERGHATDYRWLGVFAAAALATKDQAYACFALTLPYCLVFLERGRFRGLWRTAAWGALGYGLLGGGLLNPTGFVRHLELITGTNSQDWREYARSAQGVLANANDLIASQPQVFWPWPIVVLAWWGVVLAAWSGGQGQGPLQRRWVVCLPLMVGLGGILTFSLVVGRAGHRFMLPLGFALAYYAGIGAARMSNMRHGALRGACFAALVALLASSALGSLSLHLTQWGDGRRAVERWLERLPRGARVETYGLGVYLPRFDLSAAAAYRVTRVTPSATPQPAILGITDIQDAYGNLAARQADALVVTMGFANRFVPAPLATGRAARATHRTYTQDADANAFFARALDDRIPGYRRTLDARARLPALAQTFGLTPVAFHGVGERTLVFERTLGPTGGRLTTSELAHNARGELR
jgi:hypothetical protein